MLEDKDYQFIIGCCLGDGSLNAKNKRSTNPVFTMSHCIAQEEYMLWKASKLNQILGRDCTVRYFDAVAKGKKYPTTAFGVSSPEYWSVYELLYKDGCKTFTWELLKPLGLQVLALFWMDDGELDTRRHVTATDRFMPAGLTRKYFREARLNLYVEESQAELVRAWIKWLTGAEGNLLDHKKNGQYVLSWYKDDFLKIINRIKNYVHPSMYWKISLDGTSFDMKPVTINERVISSQA